MNGLGTLIKKDFTELVRSKKLMILAVIFAFVALLSPAIAKLIPELFKNSEQFKGIVFQIPVPTYKDSIDQYIKNLTSMALLVLIFLAAGSVAEEKSRKTLELLLVKPVTKTNVILSKFLTYLSVTTLVFVAASALFYVYTMSIFGSFDLMRFTLLAFCMLVYILLITSITIFMSTFSKNTVVAAGLGLLGMILVGSILGLIQSIANYAPAYIVGNYADLIANGWSMKFLYPTLINLCLIVVIIIVSMEVFKRQEVER